VPRHHGALYPRTEEAIAERPLHRQQVALDDVRSSQKNPPSLRW
jgi:hypothetical protein